MAKSLIKLYQQGEGVYIQYLVDLRESSAFAGGKEIFLVRPADAVVDRANHRQYKSLRSGAPNSAS